MNLILYPANETQFESNGIGILADAFDDEVREELNGQFELSFQYPIDGAHFGGIATDAYVTAKPNPVSDPQPFRIYRITKPLNGIVRVYARHRVYRLNRVICGPFSAVNAADAMQKLGSSTMNDCPFTFWTDKDTEGDMTVEVPTDAWTLMGSASGSILGVYDGEYEFDRDIVKLHSRRGTDRGVTIRYGKNLTDLQQDENIAAMITGIVPYWTDGDGTLVTLPEKYVSGPGEYPEDKLQPVDFSREFKTQPTVSQLRERAVEYVEVNQIGVPEISWTIHFVQLEQTEEYKGTALLERVLLGDTVSVIVPQLNVNASARAVEARYIPSLDRYKSVTLGRVKSNLARTAVQQKVQIEQATRPSALQAAVDRATKWITGGKGYMVAVRDADGVWTEICSLDEPDIEEALKVWRWNNAGLGFSKTGYNGPYTLAITQDGAIVADFITTGTLDASLVNVTNLNASNINAGTLDAGKINVENLSADKIKAGTIRSTDETMWINLDTGRIGINGTDGVGEKVSMQFFNNTMHFWGPNSMLGFVLIDSSSGVSLGGLTAPVNIVSDKQVNISAPKVVINGHTF